MNFRLASASATIACALLASTAGAPEARVPVHRPQDSVEIQMHNVSFRLTRDIILQVANMRGRLKSTQAGRPVTFDDSNSFVVEIDTGEVAVSADSLAALLNSYVLAYPHAPIKNVKVEIRDNKLVQKGTLHKGVDLPFEMEGSVSTTPEGDIRVHADKIKSGPLPFKGLLHFFGEDLEKIMHENAGRGLKVDGDDLILMLRGATPPPHLDGKVTQVRLENGNIVQVFDSGKRPKALRPPVDASGYIYHRGGVLRFGKLTMNDADLEIVGDRPGKAFDFFLGAYKKQLVAGYSKNTQANGLVSHMVDYSRFEGGRGAARGSTAP